MTEHSVPTNQVLWRSTTSRHDWRDRTFLRAALSRVVALGLVDPAVAMLDVSASELTISGESPAPWTLFWKVYPFDAEEGWVDGMNSLWLSFDRARIADSPALLAAFRETHTAENTEYASLHPYDHWSALAQRYLPPVTINPMFRGVFWAQFFGPGHLDEFDASRLKAMSAPELHWQGERGLCLITAPTVNEADAPETERRLLALTSTFRDALKATSRFHR